MNIGNLEVYGVIYKITNIVNNKVYIGQTVQDGGFKYRYNGNNQSKPIEWVYNYHLASKKRGDVFNEHLLSSINKYGLNSFKIDEIFDVSFSKEELNIKEKCWISTYISTNPKYGYNSNDGGDGGKRSNWSEIKQAIKRNSFIICKNDNKAFINAKKASDYYNISKTNVLWRSTNNKIKNGLEFLKYEYNINYKPRIILDMETFELFYSYDNASEKYKIKHDTLKKHCCKKTKYIKTIFGKKQFRKVEDII